jgi:hypothetical protein
MYERVDPRVHASIGRREINLPHANGVSPAGNERAGGAARAVSVVQPRCREAGAGISVGARRGVCLY